MTLFSCVYFLPFCRSSHSLYSLIFVLFHLSFFSDSPWIQVFANPTSKVIILQEGGGRGAGGGGRGEIGERKLSSHWVVPVIQLNHLTGCMPNLNCGWFCSCCCCCVLLLLLLLFTFLLLLLFLLFWREEP